MKFGIDMGHNAPPDTGAVGIKREDDLTKDVGNRLMQKLSAAGHSVINCTPSTAASVGDSLGKRVNKVNANQVDIFVSIHFNAAFRTDRRMGTEIYAISNAAKGIAQPVLNEILKLSFKNRGIKNTAFFVIKNTSMPAILIECCFIDSTADMNLFNAEKMAEAIKVGLIGDGEAEDTATVQPGRLKITQKTILKPSTVQSSAFPPERLINIDLGEYPVLDFRREERHYWVKWPDKSQGNRDEHFVFEEHAEMLEKMPLLDDLVNKYAAADLASIFNEVGLTDIDPDNHEDLKEVTLAQWLLESARASSKLSMTAKNFAGLKWREEMRGFATPIDIKVPSEPVSVEFCQFKDVDAFLLGY